jgi:hypothetical protein
MKCDELFDIHKNTCEKLIKKFNGSLLFAEQCSRFYENLHLSSQSL